jgi:hypothetical protein
MCEISESDSMDVGADTVETADVDTAAETDAPAETEGVAETAETPETGDISEATEANGDLDADIDSQYDEYLENDSAQEYEHESAEERDVEEVPEIKGGSYGDIKDNMRERGETGGQYEVHHMPADSCTDIPYEDGPAIKMEKADHRETASCGNSRDAQEYRKQQAELINDGKYNDAVQMDIDDVRSKFGSKYDDGIAEMQNYSKKYESGR